VTTARILEEVVAGYQAALSTNFEADKEKSHRPKSIQALLAQSTRRRWRHLAEERLDTVKPTIPLGKRWARHRQAHHSPRQAVLGADAGRTQGHEPDVRKRFCQAYAHFTSRP
jgi:hypothetical protein